MAYYFAPMEGITNHIYRNAYHKHFEGFNKYFTPFIAPNKKRYLSSKSLNDILPEHNEGVLVVPQILTNKVDDFVGTAKALKPFGYDTVNLNLGCPSPTVVTKGKGSAMLDDLKVLERFLEGIFDETPMKISIKTRTGFKESEDFEALMHLFNKFPLEELIVHPRTQKDFYQGPIDLDAFSKAVAISRFDVCYNGDLFTASDYLKFKAAFPSVKNVMLGRGILRDPNLLGEVVNGSKLAKEKLLAFHDTLFESYKKVLFGDDHVLSKMKEVCFYLAPLFEGHEKPLKHIKKAKCLSAYGAAVNGMFQCPLRVGL